MFFLGDINNIEFERTQKVKVKAFVRQGKLVKAHDRNQNIKAGLIGAASVLGLGGAYLLGKRGTVPKQLVNEMLENQNKNIKNIVKEALENQKPPVININTPEIRIPVQPIKLEVPQQIISKAESNVVSSVNTGITVIKTKKIPLPKNPSSAVEKLTSLSDRQIEASIRKRSADLNKYSEVLEHDFKAAQLKVSTENLKKAISYLEDISIKDATKIKSAERAVAEQERILNISREYFGLPKVNKNNMSEVFDFKYEKDNDYLKQLSKVTEKKKESLNKYIAEQKRRQDLLNAKTVNIETEEERLKRVADALDDFSFIGDLVNFKKSKATFFLGEIHFARKLGSKDKKKRRTFNLIKEIQKVRNEPYKAITKISQKERDKNIRNKTLLSAGLATGLKGTYELINHLNPTLRKLKSPTIAGSLIRTGLAAGISGSLTNLILKSEHNRILNSHAKKNRIKR